MVEEEFMGEKRKVNETKYKFRDAGLQFGLSGDSPVHPELITFLVTGEAEFKCH